jgi:hypothetical protein
MPTAKTTNEQQQPEQQKPVKYGELVVLGYVKNLAVFDHYK